MNIEKIKKSSAKTIIQGVRDILKKDLFKWVDTGKSVSYDGLLNVLDMKEPLSFEEAKRVYSSLSNNPIIKKV